MRAHGEKNVTYAKRLQLEAYFKAGLHKKEIAKLLGVSLVTVYNELKRGAYEHTKSIWYDCHGKKRYNNVIRYSAELAEEKYRFNMTSHGAPLKVGNDFDFINYVEKRVLQDHITPCAVIGELRQTNMFKTRISKATLYRYIHTNVFLNISDADLPFRRKRKKHHSKRAKSAPRGTSIELRPAEVLERNTFGHWEMDCVIGKKTTRDVLLVFSERLTRYEIIVKMSNRKTKTVVKALNRLERRFGKKFRKVFKSITVDNGSEFADFVGLEKSIYNGTRVNFYYCHPYSSYERGTNERINRDIRRLIPKGTDLASFAEEKIQFVENWVNNYPRAIFDYSTSAVKFEEQLQLIS